MLTITLLLLCLVLVVYCVYLRSELAQARKDSIYDPLTDLVNIREFNRRLKSEYALMKRANFKGLVIDCAFLFIDIDKFKSINDTLGHKTGDKVLVFIANLLKEVFHRDTDVVARIGGDEFGVLIQNSNEENCGNAIQLFNTRLAETPLIIEGGAELRIEASMGCAFMSHHPDPAKTVEAADKAMYKNKQEKKVADPE
ncbi:MAG: GGDEF domain-containing protein [bacterium]|nr:GGDEF domain-containing protein [bacterium]